MNKLQKDSKQKIDQKSIFKGIYKDDPLYTQPFDLPTKIRERLKNSSLLRYGSTLAEMNEYVLGISNQNQFDSVIQHLKTVVSTDDWVSALEADHVYITPKNQQNQKYYRSITLQERKNLLSAILNKVKVEVENNNEIKEEKYKGIFLADPDSNFSLTGEKHQSKDSSKDDYEEKIKEKTYFTDKVKTEVKNDQKLLYTMLQINNSNFSSFDNFKKWVNKNLSVSLF